MRKETAQEAAGFGVEQVFEAFPGQLAQAGRHSDVDVAGLAGGQRAGTGRHPARLPHGHVRGLDAGPNPWQPVLQDDGVGNQLPPIQTGDLCVHNQNSKIDH
jgi:hypothetical protein